MLVPTQLRARVTSSHDVIGRFFWKRIHIYFLVCLGKLLLTSFKYVCANNGGGSGHDTGNLLSAQPSRFRLWLLSHLHIFRCVGSSAAGGGGGGAQLLNPVLP